MRQTSPTLVLRVPWELRERLWQEAALRGVDPSALMRGLLRAYLDDIGDVRMGFQTPTASIIRLVRPSSVEIRIPRRQRGMPDE